MGRRSALVPFLVWFVVGVTISGTLQILRAETTGGAEGLVFAGRLEPAHQVVVAQLPSAPVAEDHGHDGQIFYAIGIDPWASSTPEAIVPAYRYRRILYSAMAGLFGTLDGQRLLWGMIVVSAISVGLAAGAVAGIAARRGMPWLTPLAVTLNPGSWLSSVFLTADNLALALGLLGVWALLGRRDGWAVAALAAAALTRETHLIFAVGLAGYLWVSGEQRRSLRYLLYPLVSLAAWFAYVAIRVGNPLVSGEGIGLPFAGLIDALPVWREVSPVELIFTITTLLGLGLALVTLLLRRRLMSWLVAPWLLLALVSSHLIWDLGNNSVRTLAPLVTLSVLGVLPDRENGSPTAPAVAPNDTVGADSQGLPGES